MNRPQTLTQKIVARAAGQPHVDVGEVVTCAIDLAMMHDSGGPRRLQPMLKRLGAKIWDPSKIVVVSDHYVPAVDAESASILKLTREFVREHEITRFHDMQGICHVVLPENGHLRPGMFVVGGDSHSPTGGAFGCFMFGVGATEMCGAVVTGEIWLKTPGTILLNWHGKLGPMVSAKDMMLSLCKRLGMGGAEYQVVQYAGDAISGLPMFERMTLCNMAAELGAQVGLIAPDTVTEYFLAERGVMGIDTARWQGDAGAEYLRVEDFDASDLAPQVAAPHSPANSGPASEQRGVSINQAYIGACTGAKINDLRMAASVLRGKRVASNVRLLVAPATTRTTAEAAADGTLAALAEAGAILMPSGCGACAGYGAGVLAEDEICIASTARNFKGRMGAASSKVYLASPYTVAAAAVAGMIVDPREVAS